MAFALGSSPLARGLLTVATPHETRRRIIPARAGFTRWPRSCPITIRDHPRSRGVYTVRTLSPLLDAGSSPLARGLHRQDPVSAPGRGIIPARAGFTPRSASWAERNGDHPRSRGVYRIASAKAPWAVGSSPLARGLHPLGRWQRLDDGIIPARAGFTRGDDRHHRRHGDHPRSRGVYLSAGTYRFSMMGSSPLARGLLGEGPTSAPTAGIIPARAGFTRSASTRIRPTRDHPRSRGVYAVMGGLPGSGFGSSPLARGLPRSDRL